MDAVSFARSKDDDNLPTYDMGSLSWMLTPALGDPNHGPSSGDLVGSMSAGLTSGTQSSCQSCGQLSHQILQCQRSCHDHVYGQPWSLGYTCGYNHFGFPSQLQPYLNIHHSQQPAQQMWIAPPLSPESVGLVDELHSLSNTATFTYPYPTTLPAYSENALDQSLNEFGTRTSLSNNSIPPRSPFAPATGGSSYSQASTSASSGPNAQQIIDPELPDFSLDIESFDLDLLLDSPQATLSQRSASCDGESLSSSDISAGLERSPLDLKKLMSPIYSGTPQAPNQQGPRLNSGSRKRRFPCTRHSCTRAFTSRNDLERHLKTKKHRNDATHSGDAVGLLRCKVPWCKRGKEGWARKDHYMRHMERMHPDLKLEDGEDSSSE